MYKIIYLVLIILYEGANAENSFDELSRISNAPTATYAQFPYAISLQQVGAAQQTTTRGHRCGGALITYQHALTAGSCIMYTNNNGVIVQITPSDYRVYAGAVLLTNDTSPDRYRSIANFTIHPQFLGPPSFLNDIAIVTLISPFPSTSVTPLSLPSEVFDPIDFTLCTVAGWGATNSTNTASTELRYSNKYIYSQNLCTFLYNSIPGSPNILPGMVCAASYDTVSSSCMGDNGNALVCNNTLTGILFLHLNCQATSYPELYTRVSNYTTWIRSVSGVPPAFTPGIGVLTLFALLQIMFVKVLN